MGWSQAWEAGHPYAWLRPVKSDLPSRPASLPAAGWARAGSAFSVLAISTCGMDIALDPLEQAACTQLLLLQGRARQRGSSPSSNLMSAIGLGNIYPISGITGHVLTTVSIG